MSEEYVTVDGLEQVTADLLLVEKELASIALLRGLNGAGAVYEKAIGAKCPFGPAGNRGFFDEESFQFLTGGRGSLYADLQHRVTLSARGDGGSVATGFWSQAYKANWVEFGHRMVTHKWGKRDSHFVRDIPAHPFMRPAADASDEAALSAFIDGVNEVLGGFSDGQ